MTDRTARDEANEALGRWRYDPGGPSVTEYVLTALGIDPDAPLDLLFAHARADERASIVEWLHELANDAENHDEDDDAAAYRAAADSVEARADQEAD